MQISIKVSIWKNCFREIDLLSRGIDLVKLATNDIDFTSGGDIFGVRTFGCRLHMYIKIVNKKRHFRTATFGVPLVATCHLSTDCVL